jgi:hypothetical protein
MSRPEDFRDDFESPRSSQDEGGSSAGLIACIFALVSIALIAVIGVLWYLLKQEEQVQQNPNREQWMALWFLFLDALSLFTSLGAVIMGVRGLSPGNTLYRGYSMTALIVGILEIGATMLFGCFLTCFAAIFAGR